MAAYRYVHVDVFTDTAFGGNPLAVLPEAAGLSDGQMQATAREFNFSETTFVFPSTDPTADARVRIFTPGRELPFAGHPVVGTAFVLARERGTRELRIEVPVGTLAVRADPGEGETGEAEMEQPLPSFAPAPDLDPAALAALVGVEVGDIASETPAEVGSAGTPLLYVRLRSLDAVRRSAGNAEAIARYFADTGLRNNVYV
ncbi:MAG: PhzF family phenazine biosynthesis protein, partial [Dehalococcoidia bacterium]